MAETGFYLVAFTERVVQRQRILGRWYRSIGRDPVVAVGERRSAAPSAEAQELRHQHAVVLALSEQADAILPVRFGAQSTVARVEALLAANGEVLAGALRAVRGKVQMTVRVIGNRQPTVSAATAAASGREYLERRRAAIQPALPESAEAFLATLDRLAADQRRQAGVGSLLATVYHLVPRSTLDRYREAAAGAQKVGALVTGPFPPFAFTPTIL